MSDKLQIVPLLSNMQIDRVANGFIVKLDEYSDPFEERKHFARNPIISMHVFNTPEALGKFVASQFTVAKPTKVKKAKK